MRKKVLMVAGGGLGNGGVQAVIMGIVRNLKQEIDFDVVLFTNEKRYYDDEFLKYGKIFHIVPKNNNPFLDRIDFYIRFIRIYKSIYKILIENGPYDAVHCHNLFETGICVFAAFMAGVKIRISHSHSGKRNYNDNLIKYAYEKFLRFLIRKYSNVKIGCSQIANDYLYGDNNKDAFVIYNFIDFEKFNIDKYKKVDSELIRFVHVGSFNTQKNQMFLLEVFKIIKGKIPNSILTLIGFGEDKNKICEKIKILDLSGSVCMMPHDANIPYILSQSDYMIFPSLHEGFGIVLLEAQAMNVMCFVSDTVTREADLGLCKFIPLQDGAQKWADIIIDVILRKENNWKLNQDELKKFDINNIIKEYKKIYDGNQILEYVSG